MIIFFILIVSKYFYHLQILLLVIKAWLHDFEIKKKPLFQHPNFVSKQCVLNSLTFKFRPELEKYIDWFIIEIFIEKEK